MCMERSTAEISLSLQNMHLVIVISDLDDLKELNCMYTLHMYLTLGSNKGKVMRVVMLNMNTP